MKPKILYPLCVMIALVVGCVPSLNPIYTENDLTFEPAMVGRWAQENSKITWEFRASGEKGYQLTYTDKDGQVGRFVAKLAEVQGAMFLDLYPEEIAIDAAAFYRIHLVPIHTVYLVKSVEPEFVLSAIDGKWLDQYLTNNPESVQYATFQNGKLLTAATADLQRFLTDHQDQFKVDIRFKRDSSSVN